MHHTLRGMLLAGLLILAVPGAGAADPTLSHDSHPSAFTICNQTRGSELWARAELYFGMSKPDGSLVTEDQYQTFLDNEVTPRFPDGFTLLGGRGQFLNASGVIIQEPSKVLIILYPPSRASSRSLDAIRDAYTAEFQQESVLRVDSFTCVAF